MLTKLNHLPPFQLEYSLVTNLLHQILFDRMCHIFQHWEVGHDSTTSCRTLPSTLVLVITLILYTRSLNMLLAVPLLLDSVYLERVRFSGASFLVIHSRKFDCFILTVFVSRLFLFKTVVSYAFSPRHFWYSYTEAYLSNQVSSLFKELPSIHWHIENCVTVRIFLL